MELRIKDVLKEKKVTVVSLAGMIGILLMVNLHLLSKHWKRLPML